MSVSEKIAHLKGLAEGLDLASENSKEARVLNAMIDILDDLAKEVAEMDENLNLVNEELDDVSDELVAFEEDYYLDDDDEDYDEADEYDDYDEEDYDDEDELDEEDGAYYIVECPKCGATMTLDEDTLLAGNIRCEACNQLFSLEVVDDGDLADEEADYADDEADDGEPDEIPF